jgi:hypothetical protein
MNNMLENFDAIKEQIGNGRVWNPYKGGFVPYARKRDIPRIKWQRDMAAWFLSRETSKNNPRPGRVKLLKKCLLLGFRRFRDYCRLIKAIRRCEMKYIPVGMAKMLDKWPDSAVGLDYLGGGIIGIFDGKVRSEIRLSQAAWELRRCDSEVMFWVRVYGDLSPLW